MCPLLKENYLQVLILKFLPLNNFGSPQKWSEKNFGHFQQSPEVVGKSLETLL